MKKIIKSNRDVKSIPISDKRQIISCVGGNSMFLRVEAKSKKGAKSFIGRMRHPQTKKQLEYFIGSASDYKFSEAQTKWLDIKKRCKLNKCSPTQLDKRAEQKTLREAINYFCELLETKIKKTTLRDYQNQFAFAIGKNLDLDTPLEFLERDKGGRQMVEDCLIKIRGNSHYELERKCRSLLNRTFEIAGEMGWMDEYQNPVITKKALLPTVQPKHHPKLSWDEIPQFLEKIEHFSWGSPPTQVLCTKFILLTALRAGAASRLKWSDIDFKKGLITIDGSTSGLKRVKGKTDHIPHKIPITEEILCLLMTAKKYSTSKEYVFSPITHSRYPHIDPEAPNNYIRKIGMRNSNEDVVVAHGWRRTFLTEGQDKLGFVKEIIKKQMGHLPDNKVDRAYDSSEHLDKRKEFLSVWGKKLLEMGLNVGHSQPVCDYYLPIKQTNNKTEGLGLIQQ